MGGEKKIGGEKRNGRGEIKKNNETGKKRSRERGR